MKLRLVAPGEGNRFLAQFPSGRGRGSRTLLLPPAGLPAVSLCVVRGGGEDDDKGKKKIKIKQKKSGPDLNVFYLTWLNKDSE